MSIEYPQILSTVHHVLGSPDDILKHLYKPTHQHHPATKWVMQHPDHYQWVYDLAVATWAEYTHRYDKVHASSRLQTPLQTAPVALWRVTTDPVPPPQCMPDALRSEGLVTWDSTIQAYQRYYREAKASFTTWKRRPVPEWFAKYEA